jgi:hypothetical protein
MCLKWIEGQVIHNEQQCNLKVSLLAHDNPAPVQHLAFFHISLPTEWYHVSIVMRMMQQIAEVPNIKNSCKRHIVICPIGTLSVIVAQCVCSMYVFCGVHLAAHCFSIRSLLT